MNLMLQWGHGLGAVDTHELWPTCVYVDPLQWGHGLGAVDTKVAKAQMTQSALESGRGDGAEVAGPDELTVVAQELQPAQASIAASLGSEAVFLAGSAPLYFSRSRRSRACASPRRAWCSPCEGCLLRSGSPASALLPRSGVGRAGVRCGKSNACARSPDATPPAWLA